MKHPERRKTRRFTLNGVEIESGTLHMELNDGPSGSFSLPLSVFEDHREKFELGKPVVFTYELTDHEPPDPETQPWRGVRGFLRWLGQIATWDTRKSWWPHIYGPTLKQTMTVPLIAWSLEMSRYSQHIELSVKNPALALRNKTLMRGYDPDTL